MFAAPKFVVEGADGLLVDSRPSFMDFGAPADEVVLVTRWFQLVARRSPAFPDPHYCLQTLDYVHVVALTSNGQFLLVRQFRPAVWKTTLELPSGHVEPGQTPEQAARAELLEETGYEAARFECLGDYSPDSGRLSNRLWSYFAADVTRSPVPPPPEKGIELVLYPGKVRNLLRDPDFCSGLNRATMLAAVAQGKVTL